VDTGGARVPRALQQLMSFNKRPEHRDVMLLPSGKRLRERAPKTPEGSEAADAGAAGNPAPCSPLVRSRQEKREKGSGGGRQGALGPVTQEFWIQCDRCHKWRHLPAKARRPKKDMAWACGANTWDPLLRCDDPRECSFPVASLREVTMLGTSKTELPVREAIEQHMAADTLIVVLQANPKAASSQSFIRYECYKSAQSFHEFLSLGGTMADIVYDFAHGYLRFREFPDKWPLPTKGARLTSTAKRPRPAKSPEKQQAVKPLNHRLLQPVLQRHVASMEHESQGAPPAREPFLSGLASPKTEGRVARESTGVGTDPLVNFQDRNSAPEPTGMLESRHGQQAGSPLPVGSQVFRGPTRAPLPQGAASPAAKRAAPARRRGGKKRARNGHSHGRPTGSTNLDEDCPVSDQEDGSDLNSDSDGHPETPLAQTQLRCATSDQCVGTPGLWKLVGPGDEAQYHQVGLVVAPMPPAHRPSRGGGTKGGGAYIESVARVACTYARIHEVVYDGGPMVVSHAKGGHASMVTHQIFWDEGSLRRHVEEDPDYELAVLHAVRGGRIQLALPQTEEFPEAHSWGRQGSLSDGVGSDDPETSGHGDVCIVKAGMTARAVENDQARRRMLEAALGPTAHRLTDLDNLPTELRCCYGGKTRPKFCIDRSGVVRSMLEEVSKANSRNLVQVCDVQLGQYDFNEAGEVTWVREGGGGVDVARDDGGITAEAFACFWDELVDYEVTLFMPRLGRGFDPDLNTAMKDIKWCRRLLVHEEGLMDCFLPLTDDALPIDLSELDMHWPLALASPNTSSSASGAASSSSSSALWACMAASVGNGSSMDPSARDTVLNVYESLGKVMVWAFLQRQPVPSWLASPVLLLALLDVDVFRTSTAHRWTDAEVIARTPVGLHWLLRVLSPASIQEAKTAPTLNMLTAGALPDVEPITMANRMEKLREGLAYILLDQRKEAITALRRGFSLGGLLKVTLRAPLLGLCWKDLSWYLSGTTSFTGRDIADRLSLQHREDVEGDPVCVQNLAWLKEILESTEFEGMEGDFLRFVTGSAILHRRLTCIRVFFDAALTNVHLPTSHTCFHAIYLSKCTYGSRKELFERISACCKNSTVFGRE